MLPPDLQELQDQLDTNGREAREIASGLTEAQGTARPKSGGWSVAECLDHLATANRVYMRALREPIDRARAARRCRRRAARPGWLGSMFASTFEPSPRQVKIRAPRSIAPGPSPALQPSLEAFLASQAEVRDFVGENADLDLATIRFRNPFVPVLRFSVATGLHVITAHERRHLVQAWRIRLAIEGRA